MGTEGDDTGRQTWAFAVDDVSYSYQDIKALNNISLRVKRGQRVALLGANGSGKSTLLRLLDGLCFPEVGTISAWGDRVTEEALQSDDFMYRFRRRVGFVFQNPDVQLFNPSVFDEVAFGPLQLGWSRDCVKTQVAAVLDLMGLSHLETRPPHRLSGGEKKRVALASVLVTEPETILLDEPTVGLDPESQSQVIDWLASWAGSGRTVVTTTHDLGIVEDIADYCYVLQAGTVAAQGRPAEIINDMALLLRTHLVHTHQHRHADGRIHSHPHLHVHDHAHDQRLNVAKDSVDAIGGDVKYSDKEQYKD